MGERRLEEGHSGAVPLHGSAVPLLTNGACTLPLSLLALSLSLLAFSSRKGVKREKDFGESSLFYSTLFRQGTNFRLQPCPIGITSLESCSGEAKRESLKTLFENDAKWD
jgi:hypothetical protein